MRVLLLSISPDKKSGNRQRTDYLAEALRLAGHEAVIVRWDSWDDFSRKKPKDGQTVSLRLLPTVSRLLGTRAPIWNQVLVREHLTRLVKKLSIDLVIWPNNWYVIGYPPKSFDVPICIDYFDLLSDEMEKVYLPKGRFALCTSGELQRRANRWTEESYWVPTPIDLSKFRYSRQEAKRSIGLSEDAFVISLIGLTASPELYFVDAIDQVNIDNIKCMLIGGGELLEPLRRKVSQAAHPERFELIGTVAYSEIPKYFCASDVGLYPGEDHDYYHCACPIKVLEYSASGSVVVSNELRELKNWNLPNVHLVAPNSQEFRKIIENIAKQSANPAAVNLETFGLKHVSALLNDIVEKACS